MTPDPLALDRVEAALLGHSVLLQADARYPSLTSIVAGRPVCGSWWGHPRASEMRLAIAALGERDDVLSARLFAGKITYVHARLWSALFGVAIARERWATDGLEDDDRALLARIDDAPGDYGGPRVIALERRLLVHRRSVDAGNGHRSRRVASYEQLRETLHLRQPPLPALAGRALLDAVAAHLAPEGRPPPRLPWR